MLRRDYLLRMIEEMGRIVARIRELLLRGDVVAAETELQAAARLAGTELHAIRALTVDSLLILLRPTLDADPERVRLVAQILALDAERARKGGDADEALRLAEKAALLRAAL